MARALGRGSFVRNEANSWIARRVSRRRGRNWVRFIGWQPSGRIVPRFAGGTAKILLFLADREDRFDVLACGLHTAVAAIPNRWYNEFVDCW